MSDLDEYLRDALRRTIKPVDVNELSSRIDARRTRRTRVRKVQAAALTVIVLAGTIGGVAVLSKAFRDPGPGVGSTPDVRNGAIVYSEVRSAGQHLWVVDPDGTGARQLTTDEGVSDSDPSISPDGHTVAFVRTGPGGSSICTIGIDGRGLAEFSPEGLSAVAPSWSPDGQHLAFAAEDGGIYLEAIDRSDPRLIVDQSFVATDLTWSPDGTRIAFAAPGDATRQGQADIWIADVQGVGQVNVTSTSDPSESSPSWSPDGASILFTRTTPQGDASLMTIEPDPDASPVQVTDGTSLDQNPSWSPDGSRVVFDRTWAGGTDVYSSLADGSDLTLVARNGTDPAWQAVPSDEPMPSPSPTADPGDDIGLGFPVCNVQLLGGGADGDGSPDFDGDGRADTAYLAMKKSDVGGCPQADTASNILGIDLTGDGTIDVEYGPIDCELDCQPFLAIDLDDDGDDELLVQQLGGAILGLVPYGLVNVDGTEDGPTLEALAVVPPGDPENGFAPGGTVTFYMGGDEGFSAALDCRGSGEQRLLVATTGQLDSIEQPTRWTIHRTTFRLGSDGLEVLDTETFDQLIEDVITTPGSEQETELCGSPFPPNPVFEIP